MPQSARPVNTPSTDEFLNLFPGQHFFRAIHPITHHAVNVGFGEHWEFAPDLEELNDRGYGIYFTANLCPTGKADSVESLRCAYQDADNHDGFAANEPSLGRQLSHASWRTSPDRYQRIWLSEPMPCDIQPHIHQFMVERHSHDIDCGGVYRLLRLPGYHNTKYEGSPLVELVHFRPELPLITDAVFFGDPAAGDPNMMSALDRPQRGDSDRPKIHDLRKERAKRGLSTDRNVEAQRTASDLASMPPGNLETDKFLDALARLNPDCGYQEWLKIVAAIHWMSEGADWGEDIADSWSSLGISYNPGSFKALWRSLKADHASPTNWTTLQAKARQCKADSPEARARRACKAFQLFKEAKGPVLPIRMFTINFSQYIQVGERPVVAKDEIANVQDLLDGLGMRVQQNLFTKKIIINDTETLDNARLKELWGIANEQKFKVDARFLTSSIEYIASKSKINPHVEYFTSLLGKWDGVERLTTFCQRLLGSPDNISISEAFELFMIAVVRRSFKPGWKFDLMPIFEGKQKQGKSSLFRRLCPKDEWFSESPRLDLEEKRLNMQIQGKLIIEFAELSGKSEQALARIKAFVSRQVDSHVANYQTMADEYARVACFVGTTNEPRYLRDPTGNRRFPVIPVLKELNWAALEAEKEQLWAEAVFKEDIWHDYLMLSPEAERDMEALQQGRLDISVDVTEVFRELQAFSSGIIKREHIWSRFGVDHTKATDRTHNKYLMVDLERLLNANEWALDTVRRIDGGTAAIKGHSKRKKGEKLREIVYNGRQFIYADTSEQEDLLS